MNTSTEKMRIFECPHCHNQLEIKARMEILSVNIPTTPDPFVDFSQKEKMILEEAKNLGLVDSLALVTSYVKGTDVPRDMDRHFLTFLRTTNTRKVPRFALNYFLETFGVCRSFQFWQGQGIGAIVIADTIRLFIPLEIVVGTMAKSSMDSSIKLRVGNSTLEEIKGWLSRDGIMLKPEQFVSFNQLRKAALNGLTLQN